MKTVLFLCTQNACRSQMAEALVNHHLAGRVRAFSAGTAPAEVHPLAVRALAEAGIDMSGARSKHVDEFAGRAFDLVVTLCGGAAEACPVVPGQGRRIHAGFDDPAGATGGEDERLAAFRRVRDRMRAELVPLVARELGIENER
ncbi:arsenate reductase ArsC [Dissulfurirhabdus thermomarina]|uniref:Arsenate reductase ArsC n=1 Tax=Dissulfurirhabdus thermomarina TaxID=1765737 RepID=A0A6N9TVP7_DISTH|nr:arsenate reductase ArsC [Dissulfurirhabdus thermomarina]NDY43497.1 arsenate reductase ArsC [Dissulfurirhabdus thermomarina]NMX23810.1 arsenate reductase ArsC [Dissulfurirhabdus thermomarina]